MDELKYSEVERPMVNGIHLQEHFSEFSESLETEVAHLVEKRMKAFKEDYLTLSGLQLNHNDSYSTSASSLSRPKSLTTETHKKNGKLPSRVFVARSSLLTELLTISHIKSIYNIFVAFLLILFINKIMENYVKTGSINIGFSFIVWAFGSIDKVFIIWLCMKCSTTILIYFCFHVWSHYRHRSKRLFDVCAVVFYFVYLCLFIRLPMKSLLRHNLPPASSFIISCEQVRLFMKTWAFVRTNIPRALMYKKDDKIVSPCPNFSRYLYFLFAPTLVYRDEYPRNVSCNWRKVSIEFLQILGCILYAHFLFVTFVIPTFQNFGKEHFSASELLVAGFSSCFPGWCCLLCAFFALLHCWMNAFAEMIRFADRMFYKDWWNSTSYARFYRTWNCVIHDWLYEYVYKELSDLQASGGGGFLLKLKFFPMLAVFFISAVVHEYILAVAFKFIYPVLLFMFGGFGVVLMFINTKAKFFNIFLWLSLILGTGILMCLYSLEWFARINCPQTLEGFTDYVVPRSWFCHHS